MAAIFSRHLQVMKAKWQKSTLVEVEVMQQQQQQTEKATKAFMREIELLYR